MSLSKTGTGEPPTKKKRLTPAEKAARMAAEEAKKKEKEALKAKKAEEQAQLEEAKRLKAEEREKKRVEKEEAVARKAAEKAKKSGMANQKKLTDMFGKPQPTHKAQAVLKVEKADDLSVGEAPSSPTKDGTVAYAKRFKPFFVKENVTLASYPHDLDEETREAKSMILREFIEGKRETPKVSWREDAIQLLHMPLKGRRGRGCVYPSVKKIMAEYHGSTDSTTIDPTSESLKRQQMSQILEALKAVPVKCLKFREDVRPPYIGTVSGLPPGVRSLRNIARNPISKSIPTINYEYDSEAEWQEDDGEDVDDLEEDEDDADADEEMDDFLDDSEDAGPARLVFSGGMEPESTGLCWENHNRMNQPAKMFKFRMEFILGECDAASLKRCKYPLIRRSESLEHHHSIDPFSSSYWQPAPSETPIILTTEVALASATKPDARTTQMAPPSVPVDALQVLTQAVAAGAGPKKVQKPLPADMHDKFKQYLRDNPNISKLGLIEFFAGQHQGCTKTQLKAAFDVLTVQLKKGPGRSRNPKTWVLREDA